MKRYTKSMVLASVLGLSLAALPGGAEKSGTGAAANWPGWRGTGTGVSTETGLPDEWSDSKNVLWKTPLPGRGHSSPVVWGNRVFLTTAIEGEAIPGAKAPVHTIDGQVFKHPDSMGADKKHTLKVLCLDRDSGQILWERTVHDGPVYDDRHRGSSYASPTPVTDGKLVYAYFGSEGLHALDFSGKPVWKASFGNLGTVGMGVGTSPVLYKGLVIVQADTEDGKDSFIVAVDAKTGKEKWRAPRKVEASWATPVVMEGARAELVTVGNQKVIAYDPLTGKELWNSKGVESNAIPSPLKGEGFVVVYTGYPQRRVYAIRTGGTGDVFASHVAWTFDRGTAYVPSGILYGGYVYFLTGRGIMTCVDAKTGEVKYNGGRVPVPATFTASPLAFDGKILLFSEDGDAFVIKAGVEHEVLRTNSLGEPIFSTPAASAGRLFIRTDKHLWAIGAK